MPWTPLTANQHGMKIILSSTFLLLLASATVLGPEPAQDGAPEPIAGQVSFLAGARGGNVSFLVGDDGILIVDDKFENTTDEIDKALASFTGKEPRYLVNTHHHGDHTGGNAHFGEKLTIFAHDQVRTRLEAEGKPAAALPVVTYSVGATLHFNGEVVQLIHVPAAHTDGDTVVWFQESNVVHMGDLYFQIGYPFIDVEGGGSVQGLLDGLDSLIRVIPHTARVIPGHGIVTNVKELEVYRDMIADVTDKVRQLKDNDFTVDDMLEAGLTADYDERWSWAFIDNRKFLESIFASLDAK